MLHNLHEADVKDVMKNYDENRVDKEFIPYLRKLNNLGPVTTCQCCVGHIPYGKVVESIDSLESQPTDKTDRWGYLALLVTPELLLTLSEHFNHLKNKTWLWKEASKLWVNNEDEFSFTPPDFTPNNSAFIVFAWDASHWPKPAEDIVEAIESSVGYLKCIKGP